MIKDLSRTTQAIVCCFGDWIFKIKKGNTIPKSPLISKLAYFINNYLIFKNTLKKAIFKYGPGPIFATRATILHGYNESVKNKMPLAIICRAFEDFEAAGVRKRTDRASFFRKVDGMISKSMMLKAYRNASLIITNSAFMKKEIQDNFLTNSQIEVLFPKIDLKRIAPKKTKINKIGFINKGSRKGIRLLLDIAELLPDRDFYIFGEKPVPFSEISSNVRHLGYLPDRKKLFASADLFIMPSAWEEPFGRVAAEALLSGKPVLVSNKGGLPEAAQNPWFVMNSDSKYDWVDKIKEMNKNVQKLCENILLSQDKLKNMVSDAAHKKSCTRIYKILNSPGMRKTGNMFVV